MENIEKIIKLFPFLPTKNDTTNLIISIVFYLLAPSAAAGILGVLLFWTVFVPFVVGLAASAYSIIGIVFAILGFIGHDSVAPYLESRKK